MKNRHIAPLLLAFIGLAALSFTTAAGVKLRLQPQKGKTYTIVSKATIMNNMDIQGQTINSAQSTEMKQTFVAKEVTSENSKIETQIESIKFSTSQMGMSFEYDSEHPESTSPMLKAQTKEFDEYIKKPVTFTYDALGHNQSESNTLMMSQLKAVIIELPNDDLTVGSKWSQNKVQEVSGTSFTVNMEYIVTAISKKSVDISFTGTIDSKEVSGNYSGTASINPQTGMTMNSTTKTNLSLTMSQQGLTIPVTMIGTTTIEVK